MSEIRREHFNTWELSDEEIREHINEIFVADYQEHTIKPIAKATFLEIADLNRRDNSTYEIYRLFEVSDEQLEEERLESERRWKEYQERRQKEKKDAEAVE